jgi:hypothetical protein
MHHHFNFAYTTGLRVRTALTAAIYRKVFLFPLKSCFATVYAQRV